MTNGKIFLTGAFGNVGENTIKHLSDQGYEIVCFDVKSKQSESVASRLARSHHFKTVWGDLRRRESITQAILKHEPDAILHLASIIAPMSYVMPDIAYEVNVNGTHYLLDGAQQLKRPPKIINVSSYTVHGPRNPHKNLGPITADLPLWPTDNYTHHKVAAEQMVAGSGLEWTTIRLPAVLSTSKSWGRHPAFMQLAFLLCLDHQMHGLDSRDAALALVNAISADTAGQSFVVAGPDDCRFTYRNYIRETLALRGVPVFPKDAFRVADPEVDESWFMEGFVDSARSQAILNYQKHSFADYQDYVHHQYRWIRPPLKLFGGLVQRQLLKNSVTLGQEPKVDSRPLWDVVRARFKLGENVPM